MQVRFFFVLLLSMSPIAEAKWVNPDHLNLRFHTTTHSTTISQAEASWDTICPSWGEKMVHGQGPLGGGVFLHFTCYEEERLVEGDRVETPWELEIRSDEEAFSITMLYEKEVLTQLKFSSLSHVLSILQDSEFSTYSILYILDTLPLFRRVVEADLGQSNQLPASAKLDGVDAPPGITLYHLDLSTEKKMVWRPEVVGSASKQEAEGTFTYHLQSTRSTLDFSKPVWMHNQQGPGHLAAIVKPILEKKYRFMVQSFFENVEEAFISGLDKGHAGVRFGTPLIDGDVLGTKTRFFGFVSEFRNGLMKGFSLFIDYWPTSTNPVEGQKASFGGSRENLGWTYSLSPIYQIPALSFGITPKVGAWNMKIVVPTNGKEIPFAVKNALSLGISGQTEYNLKPFLFRLYYEKALSVKFAFQNTQVTVDRTGFDLYWNLNKFDFLPKAIGLSLLGFACNEVFSFKKKATQEDLEAQGIVITDLKYTQLYLGGGVALTW